MKPHPNWCLHGRFFFLLSAPASGTSNFFDLKVIPMKFLKSVLGVSALPFVAIATLATTWAGEIPPTMGKEPVISEPAEKIYQFSVEQGYASTYIFRGNDFTPDSDGILTTEAQFNLVGGLFKGLKTDFYFIDQLGTTTRNLSFIEPLTAAQAGYTPSNKDFLSREVRIRQDEFQEYDFTLAYQHDVGPLTLEIGDVFFLLHRGYQNIFYFKYLANVTGPNSGRTFGPYYGDDAVSTARIDRLYLSVSTKKLPYVIPSLTYYQNLYNSTSFNDYVGPEGAAGNNGGLDKAGASFALPGNHPLSVATNTVPDDAGYLELKLYGHVPVVKDIVSANPYFRVAYSFGDRPVEEKGAQISFPDRFSNMQLGLEVPVKAFRHMIFTPYCQYIHLFELTLSDRSDNFVGGAKLKLTF